MRGARQGKRLSMDPSKHVQLVMAQGLFSNFKQPVYFNFDTPMNSNFTYSATNGFTVCEIF